MATNLSIKLVPETLRTLAFGSILAGYSALGTALANPSRLMILQNFSDAQVTFSFDGTNDHVTLPVNGQVIFDWTTNRTDTGGTANIAKGTIVYVKRTSGAPTLGSVYLSTFYGTNG